MSDSTGCDTNPKVNVSSMHLRGGLAHAYTQRPQRNPGSLAGSILICLALTGCATPPLWLANHYNSLDPCQRDPMLSWCGSASGRQTIYSTPQGQPLGAPIGYVQKSR